MIHWELERRVQRLVDIEAIQRLMSLYCYHADNQDNANWSKIFTADGIFESDLLGKVRGRSVILDWKHRSFAIHYSSNAIIDVDGDEAFGRWLLNMPCSFDTAEGGKRAVWAAAKYENDLLKVNGEWLFKHVRLKSIMWTPFDRGWELERIIGAA